MDMRSLISPCRPDQVADVLCLLDLSGLLFGCDSPASLEAQLAHDPASILVAEWDGRVVGCIFVLYNPLLTGLYHLAVDPFHQRLGLGRALLAAAEDQSRAHGTACFAAYIVADNQPSLALCAKLGYAAYAHPITCVSKLT